MASRGGFGLWKVEMGGMELWEQGRRRCSGPARGLPPTGRGEAKPQALGGVPLTWGRGREGESVLASSHCLAAGC